MKIENTIHDRFKLAMFPSLIMGLLTNGYIATLLLMVGATNALYSPIIGSVIFLICYVMLKRDTITSKLAFLVTCYTVAVEIAIHTYILGWDCGFFYFIFLLPMVFLLNSTWKRWMIIFFNGTIAVVFFGMRFAFFGKSGVHDLPLEYVETINLLNASGVGAVVIVILISFSRTIHSRDEALTIANIELEQRNSEISDQHRHLQILLKEVHHRVKNNLQIISSLMSLHSRTVKDPEVVKILNESRRRVEAIALIHQKLYQGNNANQVNFKSYLNELISSQQTMNPHVKYFVQSDEAILTLDASVPLGLIISEMITNSIKHAFQNVTSPQISITLSKQDENFELVVSDNGCGLSSDFSLTNPASLGTEIIMALVEQIDAKINHSNHGGARFSIAFQDIVKPIAEEIRV